MRKMIVAGCLLLGIFGFFLPPKVLFAAEQKVVDNKMTLLARGEYLVNLGGCNDCHTPKKMSPGGPVPDETRLLAGHPSDEKLPELPPNIFGPDKWGAITNTGFTGWVGPWGTSYASNLSPDRETGTGVWQEELFIKIIRTGKFMGSGRDILPPMPWDEYAKLTYADLKAIFAYLKSINPIKNQVPASVPVRLVD